MPQTPPRTATGTRPQPARTGTAPQSAAAPAAPPGPAAGVLPLVPSVRRPPPGVRPPRPDAAAVRRLAVPDCAPPYDDELRVTSRPGHVPQGAGAAQPTGPAPGQATPGEPDPGETARGETAPGEDRAAGTRWPGQFAQVLAEALAGSRPPRQVTPWTTEQARKHIRQLGPLLAAGQRPQVRRVVTSRPAADVVEMTAIVTFGPRIRVLAVRLERNGAQGARPGRDARPARWLCTAVEAA
jgi:Family of unknown function (DUF6459)